MDFAQLQFDQTEPMFSHIEPDYSYPTPYTDFHQQSHSASVDGLEGRLLRDHGNLHASHRTMSEDLDDIDGESKPRLTQAQITTLEEEFNVQAKPRTEYKKMLADRLRLDMQRVNNWFQNRRAKAKHQKHPSHENDRPSDDNDARDSSLKLADEFTYTQTSSGVPFLTHPISTGDFASGLGVNFMSEFDQTYQSSPNPKTNTDILAPFSCGEHLSDGAHTWSPESCGTTMQQLSVPSMFDISGTSWSPQSSANEATPCINGMEHVHKSLENEPLPMYHGVLGDDLTTNLSVQTLVSNPSSDDEFSNLMTPPTKTPPMPWVLQDSFSRRESEGSELANGLDTFHLQQPQPQSQFGMGLSSTILSSTADGQIPPHTGMVTPESSPNQVIAKSETPAFDLASRRKRQRPAALRPGTNRSHSYGESPTVSTHSRVSSNGLAPTSSVRRIRSTGNNLNVLNGRVSKPGSSSTQLSPRNIQTHFESHAIPQANFASRNGSVSSSYTTGYGPPTPLSSTSIVHPESAKEWHQDSPKPGLELTWNHTFAYGMPQATSSVPELHLTPPQTHTNVPFTSTEITSCSYQQSLQNPPQSAPSHQTTFFRNSPPIMDGKFASNSWQGETPTPSETYPDIARLSTTRSNAHFSHSSLGGTHNVPFAPKVQLPPDGPPGMGWFQTSQPITVPSPPPAAQNGLDIRVEIGPTPMLRLTHDTYTFNNTVPEDLAPTRTKK